MFFAYAIIHKDSDVHDMFINKTRITPQLDTYLNKTNFFDYETITDEITKYSNMDKKIWISPMSSFAIYNAVTKPVMFFFNLKIKKI